MANLKGKLSQYGDAVVLTQAYSYFNLLNKKLSEVKSQSLNLKQGYISKYELVDDLRKALRPEYKTTLPPNSRTTAEDFNIIQPLLDVNKGIIEIAQNESEFNTLSQFLQTLAKESKGVFNPTLSEPFTTTTHNNVYSIPAYDDVDVRRYGRVLICDKFSLDVKKWLINNAPLYGFVMYEDYGLYYVGLENLKKQGSTDAALQKLINQFQRSPIAVSSITLQASTLQKAKDPTGLPLDPVSYPEGILDNNGRRLELVRVDSQTISRQTFEAYRLMYVAAKADGINLKVGSGFRPAAGPSATWTSASGKTGEFTTQESIRRSEKRWVKSNSAYKRFVSPGNESTNEVIYSNGRVADGRWGTKTGKEAFVWYAPSTAFSAATAPPGLSNHGTGVAIDLNTGSGNKAKNNPVYHWLAKNSWRYGFVRAVKSEEWHFEYQVGLGKPAPTSPFVEVGESNRLWYNIFKDGYNAGGPNNSSDPPTTSQVLLMTGLTTANSAAAQLSEFKKGYNGTVSQFGYLEKTKLINAIKQGNPDKVVLYSAGAASAKSIATAMKDAGISRSNLYILEPYNSDKPGGTKLSVKSAVLDGTPAQNVIVGPTTGRGKNILSQFGNEIQGSATSTPSSYSHHTSLRYLGETL